MNVIHRSARHRIAAAWRFAALLTGLGLAGCVHLEQHIVIDRDGSAEFRWHYSVAQENVGLLVALHRTIAASQSPEATGSYKGEYGDFLSEEAARRYFSAPGIHVREFRTVTGNGRHDVFLTVRAADAERALETGKFGPVRLTRTETGDHLLEVMLAKDETAARLSDAQRSRLRALTEGFSAEFTVTVPTRILSTTAPTLAGRSATWRFDAAANPAFLERTPVIDLRFSGDDLAW